MLEDFLFKNRNKNYGAWQLRRRYQKTIWTSLLISSTIFFLLFYLPMLLNYKKNYLVPIELPPVSISVELLDVPLDQPKEEVPPENKKEENLPLLGEKTDVPIDTTTAQSDTSKNQEIIEEKVAEEPQDPRLQEEAIFSCGSDLNEFRSWFMSKFSIPESLSHSQDEIQILLQFKVNKQGLVDNIEVQNEIHPLLYSRVESLLIHSPRWKTCIYDGKPIKQQYFMPIFIMPSKVIN